MRMMYGIPNPWRPALPKGPNLFQRAAQEKAREAVLRALIGQGWAIAVKTQMECDRHLRLAEERATTYIGYVHGSNLLRQQIAALPAPADVVAELFDDFSSAESTIQHFFTPDRS